MSSSTTLYAAGEQRPGSSSSEAFLQRLLHRDAEQSKTTWSDFFCNVPVVVAITGSVTTETANLLLEAGSGWEGEGLNTSQASKRLFAACGVGLVSADFKAYKEAFLFSLALHWGIEIPSFQMTDKQSEAAFALCQAYAEWGEDPWPQVREPADEGEDRAGIAGLPWDEKESEMAPELAFIWNEVKNGRRKLELRVVLEGLPRFKGLPLKPPENNHRSDSKSPVDKQAKEWQQKSLHLGRFLAQAYNLWHAQEPADPNLGILLQQAFQLNSEVYHRMEAARKEASIPGSAGNTLDNGLFGKEELQAVNMNQKINRMPTGSCSLGVPPGAPQCSFRHRMLQSSSGSSNFWTKRSRPFHMHQAGYPRFKGFGFKGFRGAPAKPYPYGRGRGKGQGVPQFKSMADFHSIFSQDERKMAMVAISRSFSRSGRTNLLGCTASKNIVTDIDDLKLSVPFKVAFPGTFFRSSGIGSKSIVGISGGGCSKEGGLDWNKISGTLVCNSKNGGPKREITVDYRLPKDKRILFHQAFQTGSLGGNLPFPPKGHVFLQNRLEKCIFPFGIAKFPQTVSQAFGGGPGLGISKCLFRPGHIAPTVDGSHENFPKNLAQKRLVGFRLSGRYTNTKQVRRSTKKGLGICHRHLTCGWNANKLGQINFATHKGNTALGVHIGFCKWPSKDPGGEVKNDPKTNGEGIDQTEFILPKNGGNFGQSNKIPPRNAYLTKFHRSVFTICQLAKSKRMGFRAQNTPGPKGRNSPFKFTNWSVEGPTFFGERKQHFPSFRLFDGGLGRCQPPHGTKNYGFLALQKVPPHKCKRIISCSSYFEITSKAKRQSDPTCGQFSGSCISLQGGGRLPHLNTLLRPLWLWCLEKDISLQVRLVPSAEDLADPWTRVPQDRGDYQLSPEVFSKIMAIFSSFCQIEVDVFASPGNAQLPNYISRYPHWQNYLGLSDALKCPLQGIQSCYANPPWKIISRWLARLRQHPHLTCLLVAPMWVGVNWWPLLPKMHVPGTPVKIIPPKKGLFTNCFGEQMPPTKWPLICLLLSGKRWNSRKYRLKQSTLL